MYEALQYLKTRGVMPLWAGTSRPMLHDELRRAVLEARRRTERWILRSYDQHLLDRLAQEAGLTPDQPPGNDLTLSSAYGPLGLSLPAIYLAGGDGNIGWMIGGLDRNGDAQMSAAAVTFTLGSVSILAGRSPIGWGVSPLGGMLFSEAAGGFNHVAVKFAPWPWLQITKIAGQDDDGRPFAASRMDFAVADNLRIGISEAITNPAAVAPYFFDPVPISHWLESVLSEAPLDHYIADADFEWSPGNGYRIFGDFLVDQPFPAASSPLNPFPFFGTFSGRYPSKIGAFAGLEMLDVFKEWDAYLQYTRIPNWTYVGPGVPNWTVGGFPMGFPLGNDFDLWYGRLTKHVNPTSTFDVWTSYLRKGPGSVNGPLADTLEQANAQYFLSGIVATSAIIGVDFSSKDREWTYSIGPWVGYTWNADHIDGATRWDFGVQMSITYSLSNCPCPSRP